MALRNQPYIPLYVNDFTTDEKLIECSAESTGVYIRIMCLMHKSDEYGKILLKQKNKQKDKQVENFAIQIAKNMPYDYEVILRSLIELLSENVLQIDGEFLIQKRMVKDNNISEIRSLAGKKGGESTQSKPILKPKKPTKKDINFALAKNEANYEDESVIVNEDKIEIVKSEIEIAFDEFEKMRIKIKKPMTDLAKEMIKKELIKLSNNDMDLAVKILNQSIVNSWQDVYPLKNKNSYQKPDQKQEMGNAVKESLIFQLNKIKAQ